MKVVHEEYVNRVAKCNLVRREVISYAEWENMTREGEMRWWRCRGVQRSYFSCGYQVCGYSRRRWGDGLKVIDRWYEVPDAREVEEVDVEF